jgi:hypothetical protein
MLKCYAGLSPSLEKLSAVNTTTSLGQEITPATEICTRYSFRCTDGDTACTPEEIAEADVWKWQYTIIRAADCEQLTLMADASSDMYKNVTCCAEKHCQPLDNDAYIRLRSITYQGN